MALCSLGWLFSPSAPRDQLIRSADNLRPGAGRLVGFDYAPFGAKPAGLDELLRLRGRIEAEAQRGSAEDLANLGALDLLTGKADSAIEWLTQATRRAAQDARWWSDLAASQLAAASEDPRHLILALAAAKQAIENDPTLAEAHFNHAVALESLFLRDPARDAWSRYLELDSSSDWASEASSRLAQKAPASELDLWPSRQAALRAAALRGDAARAAEIAARSPQPARLYGEEELLAEWAQAAASGNESGAADALRIARAIGQGLARSGDRMLLESVEILARQPPGAARERLARGHLAYRDAFELLGDSRIQEAGPLLETARAELHTAGSPFALWARFQLASRGYRLMNQQDHDQALHELAALDELTRLRGYQSLRARTAWLTGTLLLFRAQASESLAAYHRAREIFQALQETGHVAYMDMLIASNLEFLGDRQGAWRHRLQALAGQVKAGEAARFRVTLGEASRATLEMGQPAAALDLQDEAVKLARQVAQPGGLSAALRQRAVIRQRLGDLDGALQDFGEAEAQVLLLPDEADRGSVLYEIRSAEAAIRVESDPAGALAALDEAMSQSTDRFFAATLRLMKARAHRALGDPLAAEADLTEALDEIERQRGDVAEEKARISYFDQARRAFEEMVELRITNQRGAEAALDAAEQGRARELGRRIAELPNAARSRVPASAGDLPAPVRELRRSLPQGVAAIEYQVRKDRTFAWVVHRDGAVVLESLAVEKEEFERQITDWREALGRSEGTRARELAAGLYKSLVHPLLRHLRADDALAFIPDQALHAIPFDALVNPATGRYLIQDRVVFVAPSLNVLAACFERARALGALPPSLLAVADPDFDRKLFEDLGDLPYARPEALEISRLYGGQAQVLAAGEVTKAAFLQAAPGYAIVHFTGHALLHPEDPFLSQLVLAPDSAMGDSGALYVNELLASGPWRTRLAVLSACSTAAGPVISRTEGVVSLATPFLAAGVPTVIASLWNVNDRTSFHLMTAFHRHLARGEAPASALRAAKLEMLASSDPDLRAPRSWAGFEAIGASLTP